MQPTTELTGRYHLRELIAAGGMGEVWRATDEALGRQVAVKLLRPEYSRDELTLLRFRAEARHTGLLNHPGIAQVYDYQDATPERPAYLVMELVSGPSLATVLTGGRLDPRRTADVLAQAAAALHAAHTAGVLHRDIKPGNLLISDDGQVKVTDFGIAQSSETGHFTRTGTLLGTTGYLAPERVAGQRASVASDLYALGIVGFECLTGQPPFRGEPLQVALAHRDQDLPALPPWCLNEPGGADLAALIASLTAKNPADRPASAALVAARARRIHNSAAARGDRPAPTRLDLPAPAGPALPAPAGPALPAPAGPALPTPARPGSPALTGAEGPAFTSPGAPAPTGPSAGDHHVRPAAPRRRRLAAAGLASGILAAGLLGWLLATVRADPAQPGSTATTHQASPPARSAAPAGTVTISRALLGRPVSVVRRELRRLGLVVQVRQRPDQQTAPGSVLRIYPTGQVPAGSVVLLTAATRPAPSTPPASAAPAPSHSATTGGGGAVSPGRKKHGKGPPPGPG
jgi:tRNA A-37 threonylcarbamoyl transferase component Bud32